MVISWTIFISCQILDIEKPIPIVKNRLVVIAEVTTVYEVFAKDFAISNDPEK